MEEAWERHHMRAKNSKREKKRSPFEDSICGESGSAGCAGGNMEKGESQC